MQGCSTRSSNGPVEKGRLQQQHCKACGLDRQKMSLPIAKHEGKGGDEQGHNQRPHSGGCVEMPKGHGEGNIQGLHAETLTHHTPPARFHGIQGQLYPDACQIPHPVAAPPEQQ